VVLRATVLIPAGDGRANSNRYCYAMDTFKGGWCNPGSANSTLSEMLSDPDTKTTCDLMNKALVADGAKPVSREEAMSGQPDKGHYIAIMVGAEDALRLEAASKRIGHCPLDNRVGLHCISLLQAMCCTVSWHVHHLATAALSCCRSSDCHCSSQQCMLSQITDRRTRCRGLWLCDVR
jgi:hypothetical protein